MARQVREAQGVAPALHATCTLTIAAASTADLSLQQELFHLLDELRPFGAQGLHAPGTAGVQAALRKGVEPTTLLTGINVVLSAATLSALARVLKGYLDVRKARTVKLHLAGGGTLEIRAHNATETTRLTKELSTLLRNAPVGRKKATTRRKA